MTLTSTIRRGAVAAVAAIAFGSAGIVSATTEPPGTEPTGTEPMGTEPMGTDPMGTEPMGTVPMGTDPTASAAPDTAPAGTASPGTDTASGPTGPLCAAVPTDGEGSVSGMADDPVGTAAGNNPLLSTLVAAVDAAGLVDTVNGPGPFTVLAPINSAFDKIPPDALSGVLADTATLTSILTYHVIPQQLSGADLVAGGTFPTANGAEVTFAQVGETIVINGGLAAVQCADVQTANATVFLIDTVLMPPPVAPTDSAAPTTAAAG